MRRLEDLWDGFLAVTLVAVGAVFFTLVWVIVLGFFGALAYALYQLVAGAVS